LSTRGDGRGDIAVRLAALLIAAVLAVPATAALLRRPPGDAPAGQGRRGVLDTVWTLVPVAMLLLLTALAVAA
jgi:hypothetical protein